MWPWKTSASGDSWVSVVFAPGRLDVARVRRRDGLWPEVLAFESFACESHDAGALRRLRGRQGVGSNPCSTLLRRGQYQLLQTDAPDIPAEERRDALRWRIKEMVDFPVEQAGIDVLDIPSMGAGRSPQVFVVAAARAVLAPRVQAFQDAKIPLSAIDIPELAQRNVAALFEEENRGLALLAFDEDGGRLTFTYKGELYASRHIDVGGHEFDETGNEALPALWERILVDIQRSLDNFDRNFSFITLARLLVAPRLGAMAFAEYLKGNLYQPVELLDLSQGLDIDGVPALAEPERQAQALLAIGAALREEATA